LKLKDTLQQATEQSTSSSKSATQSWTSGLYFKTLTTRSVERAKQHTQNGATPMALNGVTKGYLING